MPNWMKLSRKDEVEIHRHGELVASGRVDMLALDGSVFWVVQNDGRGRAMFLHSDGYTVLRLPRVRPVD
jgi:very-short-patch-repair endonuclease